MLTFSRPFIWVTIPYSKGFYGAKNLPFRHVGWDLLITYDGFLGLVVVFLTGFQKWYSVSVTSPMPAGRTKVELNQSTEGLLQQRQGCIAPTERSI